MACAWCLLKLEIGRRYGSSFRSLFVLGSSPEVLLPWGTNSLVRLLVLFLSDRLIRAGLAYVRTSTAQPLLLGRNILLGEFPANSIHRPRPTPSFPPLRNAEEDQRQASEQVQTGEE